MSANLVLGKAALKLGLEYSCLQRFWSVYVQWISNVRLDLDWT
jgi:hypothetical protein